MRDENKTRVPRIRKIIIRLTRKAVNDRYIIGVQHSTRYSIHEVHRQRNKIMQLLSFVAIIFPWRQMECNEWKIPSRLIVIFSKQTPFTVVATASAMNWMRRTLGGLVGLALTMPLYIPKGTGTFVEVAFGLVRIDHLVRELEIFV